MVADVNLAEGTSAALVAAARAVDPQLKVILVAPAARPPPHTGDAKAAPDVLLLRPFRIRQFAEALTLKPLAPPPLEGTGPSPTP